MSYIQNFFTSRDNNANAETYVGQQGRLWWDPVTNQIYSSDGNTPGGIPLAGGGGNGTPGGSNSQVQFNQNGTFGGSANLTFNSVTGALTAVSFAGNSFVGNNVQFNTALTPITAATGQMFWDTGEHTVSLGMENGVTQQIGLEQYMYIKADAAIADGQVVMFAGANGNNLLGVPADTTAVGFKPEYIMGIATQDIARNGFGYVTTFGLVHGLTTNTYTVGDILWVDNAVPGGLTNIQPADPNFQIQMAAVTKTSAGDGHIMVRPSMFYDINRITNVNTTSPTNGQALVYDGANSVWINGSVGSATTAATVTDAAQPNITSVGTLTGVTSTGNISTTGNVVGNYILGNGSQLTGIAASYGNANVATFLAAFGSNVISTTGNITGGNLNTTGLSLSGNVVSAINTTTNITTTANITGGNVIGTTSVAVDGTGGNLTMTGGAITGAGSITSTGNITGGNLITAGLISASGNITGGNVLSNGQLSTAGNITGGNITVGGAMTAVGNISASYINGAYYTGTWSTNFVALGNVSATGNVISTGAVYSNYNTNTANTGSFMAQGGNTKGGTGYLDFLVVQNTSGGATNPYKWLRVNSTGGLEIINSAYTSTVFSLTDSGNVNVSGQYQVSGKQAVNGPAFRAYIDGSQTISSGSQQKVTFGSETFDTNANFASSRFTPTVEGYYQLNATVRISGSSGLGEIMLTIWKNGSEYARGTNEQGTEQGNNFYSMQVSDLAYANGSTDYFEIYIQQTTGGNRDTTAGTNISYFSGVMVRGA
jgi:hypothetical protein